jgi:hypothetical protein
MHEDAWSTTAIPPEAYMPVQSDGEVKVVVSGLVANEVTTMTLLAGVVEVVVEGLVEPAAAIVRSKGHPVTTQQQPIIETYRLQGFNNFSWKKQSGMENTWREGHGSKEEY